MEMKMLLSVALLLMLSMAMVRVSIAKEYKTYEPIVLTGDVQYEMFKDANDKPERAIILILSKPIDVAEDEYGYANKNVRKIQIVLVADPMKNVMSKTEKLIVGRHVKINGTLFHSQTAHHHTPVLIEVDLYKGGNQITIEN